MLPSMILWHPWQERNNRIFNSITWEDVVRRMEKGIIEVLNSKIMIKKGLQHIVWDDEVKKIWMDLKVPMGVVSWEERSHNSMQKNQSHLRWGF